MFGDLNPGQLYSGPIKVAGCHHSDDIVGPQEEVPERLAIFSFVNVTELLRIIFDRAQIRLLTVA